MKEIEDYDYWYLVIKEIAEVIEVLNSINREIADDLFEKRPLYREKVRLCSNLAKMSNDLLKIGTDQ